MLFLAIILGLVDAIFTIMGILLNEELIVFVFLFTRLSIEANVLVALCTAPHNVFLVHLDIIAQLTKDHFVNLLHQECANSYHVLVGEELVIILEHNRENLLSHEVEALAQAGTQTVLFAPLIFVVVNVLD